jgi:uncharacterized membrane protein SirB2
MYETLKIVHMSSVALSISGFLLRGFWSFRESPMMQAKIVRILPHVIDTVLLISGAWLVYVLRLQFLYQDWLLAKFGLLILYIALGSVALRPGRSFDTRQTAFAVAIIVFLFILGAAITKSPASWLSLT